MPKIGWLACTASLVPTEFAARITRDAVGTAESTDRLTMPATIKVLSLANILKLRLLPGLRFSVGASACAQMAKQRRDSLDIFEKENREDLAEKEREELAIIEKFLPKQMSEDELKAEIKKIIEQVGAKLPADMGKVMGVASKQLAGKTDGKAISDAVKQLLS